MKSKKLAKRYVVDSEKGGKTTDEIKEIGERIRSGFVERRKGYG